MSQAVLQAREPVRVVLPGSVLSHAGRVLAADPELMLVSSAPQPQECFAVAQELAPCILILSPDSLNALSKHFLTLSSLSVRTMIVDAAAEDAKIKEYIRAGYYGVLNGREKLRVIRKALQVVAQGEIWASRRIVSELVRDFARADSSRNLTPRESEILALITQGHNNREIADKLFVTRETIRWHVRSLYSKLGVQDRSRLMRRDKRPPRTT